ncbi:MAG: isoprenylcysteine carboxylmethyltransferase family protein [Bacillota bacterium]|nr:isoprenylcysteine carboxylmethyltransferase family protein [Bacillota bacterium]
MKRILPPTLFMICIGLMVLIGLLFPICIIINFPYNLIGILVIVPGIAISAAGENLFKHSNTTVMTFDEPTCLVLHGLYRFSRNPMYLGFVLALLGLWIVFSSISSFLVIIVFVILVDFFYIRFEEAALNKKFGKEYLEYTKRVRKWI